MWTEGMHVSTTFFWHISEWAARMEQPVPWGVTANLLLKWNKALRFDETFPKTGGGEEIDICIQAGGRFVPVPDAIVHHPWRETAIQMYARLFQWAVGDGILNRKYPRYTYRSWPTLPELILPWVLFAPPSVYYVPFLAEIIVQTTWILVVHRMMYGGEEAAPVLEGRSLSRKTFIAVASIVSRNASELGHLYGHVSRGRLDLLCTRFDWFLASFPEGIRYERRRSFAFVLTVIAIMMIHHR